MERSAGDRWSLRKTCRR
ncbi:Bgt-50318 [Blumeria graminis f. sp. tritici]|uniref:Bgt-50318 n=1 Tax=Blumeria graminis f. sp. tritici TaxID=62690 RepID=A0A9X9MEY2_BLUGR|nr:Bgt-50318 [Blumeria graminis f. sp. tritici]